MTVTVSRSEFVKLAGALAGSLALGVSLETRAPAVDAASVFAPDVWLQIDPNDAVTVRSCRLCQVSVTSSHTSTRSPRNSAS